MEPDGSLAMSATSGASDGAHAPVAVPQRPDGRPAVEPRLWALHCRHHASPTSATRSALVDAYAEYATSIARRMHRKGEPIEDLVQVAFEALLTALERFDPHRGIPFKGFASPTIHGSIKRHFRDNGWSMHVPRRIHELASPVRRETDRLTMALGRTPTIVEVSVAMGVPPNVVHDARRAMSARSLGSLDQSRRSGGPQPEPPAASTGELEQVENRMALRRSVRQLNGRDRDLLHRYFFEDRTQSEIAEEFHVSQMQVSRWLATAVQRLRRAMLDADA